MKKTSKIISILLVSIMTLSVFAVSASAVATPLVAGNTREAATNIPSYGVEYTSELSKAGEQDWFKFTTLSEDAYYTICLENYNITEHSWSGESDYNLNLYVYDAYNKEIARLYKSTTNTNIKLEKNTTYYIKVAMGFQMPNSTGNYEVFVSYKLDSVSNNKENATVIDVNTAYKDSLDGTGDSDWFSFIAPIDGTYKISLENYNITEHSWSSESDYNLNLYVYDAYNKEIARLYRSTTNTNIKLEKNTTYYIKVAMGSQTPNSTGNYGFSVTCDTLKSLSKITIDSMPSKTTYAIGESFDQTGLKVTAHYSDGSTKEVTSCTVYGFDSSSAGTKSLTISYTENGVTKTTEFKVTINEAGSPSTPDEPDEDSDFDFMAILTAIWNFFVGIFNFIIGLFA